MKGYVGIFWLFSVVDVWAIMLFVLVVGTPLGIIFLMVTKVRGFYFNTSYSGMLGAFALVAAVSIGATAIQRGGVLPTWFSGALPQIIWFAVSVIVGIILVTKPSPLPHTEMSGIYCNLVMIPLFLFLVPLLFLATMYNGTAIQKVAICLLLLFFALLLVYDYQSDRLNQSERLTKRFGLHFTQEGRVIRYGSSK